jgi:hypothetical protein
MVRGCPSVHQVDPGVDEPTGDADVSPWRVVPQLDSQWIDTTTRSDGSRTRLPA